MPPKKTCPICFRNLRLKWFVYNRVEDKKICKRCSNRIGTNPFYDPSLNFKKKKGVPNLKMQESQVLFIDKKGKGKSKEQANKEINAIKKQIRKINYDKWKKKRDAKIKMSKFLEGLQN